GPIGVLVRLFRVVLVAPDGDAEIVHHLVSPGVAVEVLGVRPPVVHRAEEAEAVDGLVLRAGVDRDVGRAQRSGRARGATGRLGAGRAAGPRGAARATGAGRTGGRCAPHAASADLTPGGGAA